MKIGFYFVYPGLVGNIPIPNARIVDFIACPPMMGLIYEAPDAPDYSVPAESFAIIPMDTNFDSTRMSFLKAAVNPDDGRLYALMRLK